MTHYRTLMKPSPWLAVWDLVDRATGKPRDYTLTIESVRSEMVKAAHAPGEGDKCLVIVFARQKKPFLCNKTNARTIAAMLGVEVEGWAGKQVTIGRGQVKNPQSHRPGEPKTIPAIVVRPHAGRSDGAEIPDVPPDPEIQAQHERAWGRDAAQPATPPPQNDDDPEAFDRNA